MCVCVSVCMHVYKFKHLVRSIDSANFLSSLVTSPISIEISLTRKVSISFSRSFSIFISLFLSLSLLLIKLVLLFHKTTNQFFHSNLHFPFIHCYPFYDYYSSLITTFVFVFFYTLRRLTFSKQLELET